MLKPENHTSTREMEKRPLRVSVDVDCVPFVFEGREITFGGAGVNGKLGCRGLYDYYGQNSVDGINIST